MIEPKSRQRLGVAREVAAAVAELRSEREMMSKRLLAVASALAS
jgi:predicted transcriptional regulator